MKIAAALLLFVLPAAAVRGQSALDGFDPNANGTVRVVVVQPDGKILIGGDFTTVLGVPRNRIARLNPDGTLDTTFDPNADGGVWSIALQADSKILAGGVFTSIGGQTRNRIARLDATTGLADSFDPNASSGYLPEVDAIAVQADGKILVGGLFTNIGGQPRICIARLDAITGLADSFDPSAQGVVNTIAVQADNKILVGGWFVGANSIGGQARNFIARLDAATGLADSFDPNANSGVLSIAVQTDGKILAAGFFTSIGGQPRSRVGRLDATTGLADSFNPNASDYVASIALQADGKILVGGQFIGANSIGGQARNRIARLNAATGLADSFNPNANSAVLSIAVQADGKILAGGGFTSLAPNWGAATTRNRIARLETDGRLDQTLNLGIPDGFGNKVYAIAVQPDGKILIGGYFTAVLGIARHHIARLNTDGTLDVGFNPNADDAVNQIAMQADGKILVGGAFWNIGGVARRYIALLDATTGLADSFDPNPNNFIQSLGVQEGGKILAGGYFTSIGGQMRNYIARLDATTGLSDSFDPDANVAVHSIVVESSGKILVGGQFTSIGGQSRNHIARLDATTGLADSFDPNANNHVLSIAVDPNDRILVGGVFTSIGGQGRDHIARLDAATGSADSFSPNANSYIQTIAVQADGRILVGGFFTGIGGQPRNCIARLNGSTGLADSFNPNANNYVFALGLEADGKILVGGIFSGANSISGQTRNFFARLTNDAAALQELSITQTAVVWARDGSSPHFTRVAFEYSNDNLNYTPLGTGIASGGKWTLIGLNLPTGQNFYIRARGYHRGGVNNGSESITESVWNAFLTEATPTPTPIASPTATVPPPPTPSPTPTPINISGTIFHCSNPVPGPVPNVTLNLTGNMTASTLSDGSGNYTFSSLASGGSYTVTPTKAALTPGSPGINAVDVLAVQRHFLVIALIPAGCRLTAADVNGDTHISAVDVLAIQRFFLGQTSGIANTGNYQFSPASRTYPGVVTDQMVQNYDTLILGDVTP